MAEVIGDEQCAAVTGMLYRPLTRIPLTEVSRVATEIWTTRYQAIASRDRSAVEFRPRGRPFVVRHRRSHRPRAVRFELKVIADVVLDPSDHMGKNHPGGVDHPGIGGRLHGGDGPGGVARVAFLEVA